MNFRNGLYKKIESLQNETVKKRDFTWFAEACEKGDPDLSFRIYQQQGEEGKLNNLGRKCFATNRYVAMKCFEETANVEEMVLQSIGLLDKENLTREDLDFAWETIDKKSRVTLDTNLVAQVKPAKQKMKELAITLNPKMAYLLADPKDEKLFNRVTEAYARSGENPLGEFITSDGYAKEVNPQGVEAFCLHVKLTYKTMGARALLEKDFELTKPSLH